MTFREHLAAARARLAAAGVPPDDAAIDADVLARHALQWDRATLVARSREAAPARFDADYQRLIDRRARREPVAHIRGHREFWGRDFAVSPAVLIPRPETELIVTAACDRYLTHDPPLSIIDIGTGSGCLAVTLALEIEAAEVTASDISEAALDVARANAKRWDADVVFRLGPFLADAPGPFDLVVANPPYVPERDRAALAPEVRDHEPAGALFGGPDGLDVIRELVPAVVPHLRDGGVLLMEIGHDQSLAVAAIAGGTPGVVLEGFMQDLQQIPRVAVIRRQD